MGKRLDLIEGEYIYGPINNRGKKLKILDLRDPQNVSKHIPKVKLWQEASLSDLSKDIKGVFKGKKIEVVR